MKFGLRNTPFVVGVLVAGAGCAEPADETPDVVGKSAAGHAQASKAAGQWVAQIPGSSARIEVDETTGSYRFAADGQALSRSLPAKKLLRTRMGAVDPVVTDPLTLVAPSLQSSFGVQSADGQDAFIVQFVSQPFGAIQDYLKSIGVRLCSSYPDHAFIAHMDRATLERVRSLPFVRWVGHYHPGFKLDAAIVPRAGLGSPEWGKYSVLVAGEPALMQRAVAAQVRQHGGHVVLGSSGRRMVVEIDGSGLMALAAMKEVLFIDEASEPEDDMDIAREIGGGDYIELVRGYTGQGVRAEVMDSGLRTTHADFQNNPALIHAGNGSSTSHGTSVFGIVFGDGASDARARGFLPDAAQPIFSAYNTLGDRMAHTARLVDPSGPYRAVFQTNSWGNTRTFNYTTISAEMDDILFTHDILILQSQSNAGDQDSRPQAWAKNILSVGGVRHFNTLDRVDDAWNGGASIGPASDGRIKPDLWHFYDLTFTTSSSNDTAHREFGGTSGATPVTAGHAGLLFQMWADGVFEGGPGQARDVFDVRPHMTTAKALLINSAFQYPFSGTSDDKTRVHQGWGMADIRNLHDIAQSNGWSLPLLIDESSVITPGEVQSYPITVDGSSPLRATMVYADPAGNPSAARHRVNDLSLRLVSPSGTIYWGNNGLLTGVWSTSGGSSNDLDTVENVFIQTPEAGTWSIDVLADEVVQDGHVETPALDADYALVVTHTDNLVSNAPPVLDPIGARAVAEGETLTFTVTASDPDEDALTLGASPLPANATFDGATGVFSFSPDLTQAGAYDITFSANDGNGGVDTEVVTITVTDAGQTYATLPYTMNFEAGTLDEFWTTASSSPLGRIQVSTDFAPQGTYHLTMDVSSNNNDNINEARLHLDLSGQTDVDLSFAWKEFSDEDNVEDGIFLSDDGGATFVKVRDLTGGSSTYQQIDLDLTSLAALNGLSLTSTFVVKFQQRDNYTLTTDGFAFDDIRVTASSCTPLYSNDFESGAGGWSFSAADSTCTTGDWIVGDPDPVTSSGVVTQVGDDHTPGAGVNAFYTQPNTGGVGTDDVDGGVCTGYSDVIDASAHGQVELSFWYYHGQRDAGDDASGDFFRVDLSNDGGSTFSTSLVSIGDVVSNAGWTNVTLLVDDPGQMVIRVQASDGAGPGDLVEGGIDDVSVCVP